MRRGYRGLAGFIAIYRRRFVGRGNRGGRHDSLGCAELLVIIQIGQEVIDKLFFDLAIIICRGVLAGFIEAFHLIAIGGYCHRGGGSV